MPQLPTEMRSGHEEMMESREAIGPQHQGFKMMCCVWVVTVLVCHHVWSLYYMTSGYDLS